MKTDEEYESWFNELEPCCFETQNGDKTYYPKEQVDGLVKSMLETITELSIRLDNVEPELKAALRNLTKRVEELECENNEIHNEIPNDSDLSEFEIDTYFPSRHEIERLLEEEDYLDEDGIFIDGSLNGYEWFDLACTYMIKKHIRPLLKEITTLKLKMDKRVEELECNLADGMAKEEHNQVQNIDEMIKVLNAYKEGKRVEYKIKDERVYYPWNYVRNPPWDWTLYEYRIKEIRTNT